MDVLGKLFTGDKGQAYNDILSLYKKQGHCIVCFMYFANLMHQRLVESWSTEYTLPENISYRKAIEHANFLFPDGIALQRFARTSTKKEYQNLNGTDFIPYVLDRLVDERVSIHLGLFSVFDPDIGKSATEIEKAKLYIHERWGVKDMYTFQTLYKERDSSFDFEAYTHSLAGVDKDIRILLVCTGTPHQEIRGDAHSDFFQEHNILVMHVGGLIDYWSGFESRAPEWVIKSRVLETPWRILQHPKKNAKKLGWMFGICRYRWGKFFMKKVIKNTA